MITESGVIEGISQRSFLPPLLWNIYCDDMFRIKLPNSVTTGFVDDPALVITAKTLGELTNTSNTALLNVLS